MNEDVYNVVYAMLTSFWYNRSTESIISLIKEVISRVNKNYETEWTEDGNILFGTLVLMFGDYGVSPRAGWINNDVKGEVLLSLRKELEDYQRSLRLWEEDDERSNH